MAKKKTGGRKKGSKNVITSKVKKMIADLIDDNLDTIQTDIAALTPAQRIKAMTDLIKLVLPKPKEEMEEKETPTIIIQEWLGEVD